ncbi:MAG TPA: amidohydrolase family protein [bacterium]|nr:amidohydrolase family protein [bacterium]HOL35485.1 amidohydrolase family protein [bacterium]HPP08907.1 amidohydrolase family protein [bacterium]
MKELKKFIDSHPFFDMHSHTAGFDLGGPVNDKIPRTLYDILTNDYLAYISSSCVDLPVPPSKFNGTPRSGKYSGIKELLNKCRGLTTYKAIREGIRDLHPFTEKDITEENWNKINRSIIKAYSTYGEREWHTMACKTIKVVKQVHIATLPYVTTHLDSLDDEEKKKQLDLLCPSLVIDGYIFTGFQVQHQAREMSYKIIGYTPKTLSDYLIFCERVLDTFIQHGGKSIKLLAAYFRPLKFDLNVSEKRAKLLFKIGPANLSESALRVLQDFLLYKILIMAKNRKLPLIVHTGYSVPSEHGNPENLENLFKDSNLSGLKISLAHAGWPNEGKAMIMARTYRNCYFDLSWNVLLSESLGYRILSEAIDMIPVNKILIGTDCGNVECFVGTVKIIRQTLYNVLAEKVSKGSFDLDTAKDIASAILYNNAVEFHQ